MTTMTDDHDHSPDIPASVDLDDGQVDLARQLLAASEKIDCNLTTLEWLARIESAHLKAVHLSRRLDRPGNEFLAPQLAASLEEMCALTMQAVAQAKKDAEE